MTIEHHKFAASEPTREEMLAILGQRVHRVYGMTLDEYAIARGRGALPDAPGKAALEVFAGDFGCTPSTEAAGALRLRR